MAKREVDQQVGTLLAEIAAIKLILHVVLRSGLPAGDVEARAEVDAIVKQIRALAFRASVSQLTQESSDRVMKVAEMEAIRFIQGLVAKPKGK